VAAAQVGSGSADLKIIGGAESVCEREREGQGHAGIF
jgi:hypothetical protein